MDIKVDWETDGEDVKLPTVVPIPEDIEDDHISDWLSDKFGWLVAGWSKIADDPDLCPDSDDGKHKPYGVSGPVTVYEDLVVDITCLHCGTSGSITIDAEDVLW